MLTTDKTNQPPESTPDDQRPPINVDWLERMRLIKPDFLLVLFEMFLTEEPKRIAELVAAWATGDTERVRFLAHALKGASATMGLERLCDACKALEMALGDDETKFVPDCLVKIQQEAEAVFEVMRQGIAKT